MHFMLQSPLKTKYHVIGLPLGDQWDGATHILSWNFCTCHNVTQMMSCVHEPNNRFKNNDSGCLNPIVSY